MTSSYTPNKYLEEPAYNDYSGNPTGWTTPMNNDLTAIDTALGGSASLTTTSGSTTLTYTQYRPLILLVSGTLTANVTYIIPAGVGGQWVVNNATTGSYTVTFVNATSGSASVVVPQGNWTQIVSTGATMTFANTAVGTAAGSNTEIMYNSGGAFAGSTALKWNNSTSTLILQGNLQLYGSTSGSVGFQAPSSGGTGVTWTLPAADGTAGQLLSTNGSGVLSWGGSASGVTSFSAGSTGLTPSTASTGNVTLSGTLAVANGGTGATTSTGSGSVVLATSPTLSGVTLTGTTNAATVNVTGFQVANAIGGNYGGQFTIYNTSSGATNPEKWLRVNPTGGFEIVNSNDNAVLFGLTDAGCLTLEAGMVAEGFDVTGSGQFTAIYGNTQGCIRNDGTNLYILKNGTSSASFDNSRPFFVNLSTSAVTIDGGGAGTTFGGAVTVSGEIYANGGIVMPNGFGMAGTSTGSSAFFSANPGASYTSGGFMQCYGSTNGAQVTIGAGANATLVVNASSAAVTGAITATGNITAYYSDLRLKTDITAIPEALDKVAALRGVYFRSNDVAAKYGYTDQDRQVGVIAQDLQKVMPEVVYPAPFDMAYDPETKKVKSKTGENYVTVQYERLVPLLIEAVKELAAKVAVLEAHAT